LQSGIIDKATAGRKGINRDGQGREEMQKAARMNKREVAFYSSFILAALLS
jgi:hypothetical protein